MYAPESNDVRWPATGSTWTGFAIVNSTSPSVVPEVARCWQCWGRIQKRLNDLAKLGPGWDGHDASPVSPMTAVFSVDVIAPMVRHDIPEPFIAPLAYGGLQYEWHQGDVVLEVEVSGPYDITVYFERGENGEATELHMRTDMKGLAEIFQEAQQRFLHVAVPD